MYTIAARSGECKQWIDDNVHAEPWQYYGDCLYVDHHFIEGLVEVLEQAGFSPSDFSVNNPFASPALIVIIASAMLQSLLLGWW